MYTFTWRDYAWNRWTTVSPSSPGVAHHFNANGTGLLAIPGCNWMFSPSDLAGLEEIVAFGSYNPWKADYVLPPRHPSVSPAPDLPLIDILENHAFEIPTFESYDAYARTFARNHRSPSDLALMAFAKAPGIWHYMPDAPLRSPPPPPPFPVGTITSTLPLASKVPGGPFDRNAAAAAAATRSTTRAKAAKHPPRKRPPPEFVCLHKWQPSAPRR